MKGGLTITHAEIYHVIVNLSLETPGQALRERERGEDEVRRLVKARLKDSNLQVTRVTVYRGIESV